jgi:ATP-binding cassette, subfamily C (CFTR/MRP), member 1
MKVERLLEYSNLPQEKERYMKGDDLLKEKPWPSNGNIIFNQVQMKYRQSLPLALRDITMNIPGGSRVGICGRTGSGKSSLFVALFRIVELHSGSIIIDGVDVSKIGLSTLRESVAIIPQHPNLFVGDIRRNLDPFTTFNDDDLWKVLKDCGLEKTIRERKGQLSADVTEGGSNFSQGEKQLICVARALLRKPKLLLLDEATASIDSETDDMIQKMVRRVFKGTTQLTIAHRLNTISDSDIIIVLDDGIVVEMDSPNNLLKKTDGHYSEMVKAAAANSNGHNNETKE